ncbi:MAG: AmmeMemoRadiSam system protein B [Acidobacteriia bacterium]|nr:AmmeMemoRadiSam system protein B [Terriglobia bacterium]
MIRPPAVAGRFYPGEPARLLETVDSLLAPSSSEKKDDQKISAIACMVPHAGYTYSGAVAAEVFRRIEIPARVILIGPRHYPRGAPMAILSEGAWQTPLGLAQIDFQLAEKIASACPLLREDSVAHSAEHSLEVQLPILQRLAPQVSFVPIVIASVPYENLESLGRALAQVMLSESDPILLIASSDMNHYESDAVTRVKDRKAIDCILALDPRGLYDTVRNEEISMCGYGAAVATLAAARELGATHAELLRYATSGEVNGDLSEVVGYAGIVIG